MNEKISEKRIILTLANQFKYKNLYKTLEAFSLLKQENTVLVVTGNLNALKEEYIALASKWNILEKVVFTDAVSDEELRLWYNAADVFVFPSLIEGFGLPPLEAMACGTPVITSDVSSLPEVVGDAGVKVDPYNAEEIAEAIKKLLDDAPYSQKLIVAGFERIKLFSESKYLENMKKFYDEIAENMNQNMKIQKSYSEYRFQGDYNYQEKTKWQMKCEVYMYWLSLKKKNISLSSWFKERNYTRIALYGMEEMAGFLIEELADSDIEVCYGIDRAKRGNVYGLKVYGPEKISALDRVDIYVVMLPYLYKSIEMLIKNNLKYESEIIGIDEVVFDL